MAFTLDPSTSISVVVPTFRRVDLLLQTLDSLSRQDAAFAFNVVVVDNDGERGEGERAALAWAARNGFVDRLVATRVRERGLSSNRNAGLQRAFADPRVMAVAMIDDDAQADRGWLSAIARALSTTDAYLYGGPTIYAFEVDVAPWIASADTFRVPYDRSGLVARLRSSNNVVLTRRLFETVGPDVFDVAFDARGGEDTHLFVRCQQGGLTAAWAADALVCERVPARRCREGWVVDRQRWSATNLARVDVTLHGYARAYLKHIPLLAKEVAAGLIRSLSSDEAVRFKGRLRLAGAAGRRDGLRNRVRPHDTAARLEQAGT